MFYFLVFLIPCVIVMTYLVFLNEKLKDMYNQLVKRLDKVNQESGQANYSSVFQTYDLQEEMVITDTTIKKLEKVLHHLEGFFEMKKSPTVANTFAPKKQKLIALSKKVTRLEKQLQKAQAEEEVALPLNH